MMNFSACLKSTVAKYAAAVFFSLPGLWSCVGVDDMLGLGLVPENQHSVILKDTLDIGIVAYQSIGDSLVSTRLNTIFFGKYQNPDRGAMTTSATLQFMPYSDNEVLDAGVTIDSLNIYVTISQFIGDTLSANVKSFLIYEMPAGVIIRDSLYNVRFDATRYIDTSKPLFRFTYNSNITGSVVKTFSFTEADPDTQILPDGMTFLQRLAAVNSDQIASYELFQESFGGFYIVPEDGWPAAGEEGAVFTVATGSDSYGYPYSSMFLYAHKTVDNETDTLNSGFVFQEYYQNTSSGEVTVYNVNVTSITHDYSGTEIQTALDQGAAGQPSGIVFLHSPAGAAPYLTFTEELTDKIKTMMTHNGEAYSALAVNRAELLFPLRDAGVPFLDESHQRAGMYYNYNNFSYIPDYDLSYESYYGEGTLPYGGYLNRRQGRFSMDITAYIQNLINNPDTAQRNIYVGAASGYQFYKYFTALNADEIQFVLTYTLIK